MTTEGDRLYIWRDGRSYMECVIERIEDGSVYCNVTWALILAIRYRCLIGQIEQHGDQFVVDHGMSGSANVNAARLID